MRLSDQSIAAFVMILQKGLMEGVDITDEFRELEFIMEEDSLLYCLNPPTSIKLDMSLLEDEDADV
jgi:hypothetical protein